MTVWSRYDREQQAKYIGYLKAYGSLTKLFNQKGTSSIPHLDSKFQETVYEKSFHSGGIETEIIDKGNTPHDIKSTFGSECFAVGIKTWMHSKPSFQKVMQLKALQEKIAERRQYPEALVRFICEKRNERLEQDYNTHGIAKGNSVYHYVTRDANSLTLNECPYVLSDLDKLKVDLKNLKTSSIQWKDGGKRFKFTFGDCQIWQHFDPEGSDTKLLKQFDVSILDDPFSILQKEFSLMSLGASTDERPIEEAYLPLYSYRTKKVEQKSGLNAWNAAPKVKGSSVPRPLNEIYIAVPSAFHEAHPDFFVRDISKVMEKKKSAPKGSRDGEISFRIHLPNGKSFPGRLTQDGFKAFQSGSNTERDEQGKLYGQDALGQWLLVDVLNLRERQPVTRHWLWEKGTDAIRLWRYADDYESFHLELAPFGAFERFMKGMDANAEGEWDEP